MISNKVLSSLQFDKILSKVADFAVLSCSKKEILQTLPNTNFKDVSYLLNYTQEAYNLISKDSTEQKTTCSDEIIKIENDGENNLVSKETSEIMKMVLGLINI